jgi:hypothetical protein
VKRRHRGRSARDRPRTGGRRRSIRRPPVRRTRSPAHALMTRVGPGGRSSSASRMRAWTAGSWCWSGLSSSYAACQAIQSWPAGSSAVTPTRRCRRSASRMRGFMPCVSRVNACPDPSGPCRSWRVRSVRVRAGRRAGEGPSGPPGRHHGPSSRSCVHHGNTRQGCPAGSLTTKRRDRPRAPSPSPSSWGSVCARVTPRWRPSRRRCPCRPTGRNRIRAVPGRAAPPPARGSG